MRDVTEPRRESAFLIRPLPAALASGAPIRLGGKPRLPQDMDWPRSANDICDHFMAEIDLARIPPTNAPNPRLPDQGTLFVFLPLAHDGLYGTTTANILYTPGPVDDLPERDPPEDMPNIHESDPCHVHADGTTDDGRLLVRQMAELLPFTAQFALNPLHVEGADAALREAALKATHTDMLRAFQNATPMPPDPAVEAAAAPLPDGSAAIMQRVPLRFRIAPVRFQGHYLDWPFVFDWAHKFIDEGFDLAIDHLDEMLEVNGPSARVSRIMNKLRAKAEDHMKRGYLQGKPPRFWTFDKPVAVKEAVDWQARRWLALSQFSEGALPEPMLAAFIDMLENIDRHCQSGSDDLRIGLLDDRVRGHNKDADDLWYAARLAFKHAADKAAERHHVENTNIPQSTRWDSRIVQAHSAFSPDPGSIIANQIFGQGYEIQSAVSDHAEDILLMQFGGGFGLPLDLGGDMVVQLWISPEDLENARFDRVTMTMDMG